MVSVFIRLASLFQINTVEIELPKGSKCAIFKFFGGVVTRKVYITRREFLQIMKNIQNLLSTRYTIYPNNELQQNFQLDVELRNNGRAFSFSGNTGNLISQSTFNPFILIYLSNLANRYTCTNNDRCTKSKGKKCGCGCR